MGVMEKLSGVFIYPEIWFKKNARAYLRLGPQTESIENDPHCCSVTAAAADALEIVNKVQQYIFLL